MKKYILIKSTAYIPYEERQVIKEGITHMQEISEHTTDTSSEIILSSVNRWKINKILNNLEGSIDLLGGGWKGFLFKIVEYRMISSDNKLLKYAKNPKLEELDLSNL